MTIKEQILAYVRGYRFRSLVETLIDKKHLVVSVGKERLEERLKKLEGQLRDNGLRVKFLRRKVHFFFVCDEPWLSMFEELEKRSEKVRDLYLKFCSMLVDVNPERREQLSTLIGDDILTELRCKIQVSLNSIAEFYRHWVERGDEWVLRVAGEQFSVVTGFWQRVSGIIDAIDNEEKLSLLLL